MKFTAVILLVCLSINALGRIDENDVYCYMKSIGIKNPEIVLKQAIYETGHFKSLVCLKKNNLFGFRSVVIYKSFATWQESVDYYKRWQDRHYTDTTEDYYHFLQR
ncbi:MAG TPA: glucosaminidase domain-containing protein, partial [Chitinophagaceae bacterium]|nr:glucosaminidase domain-containing protein [Chitinophagaceae bacterium]